MWSEEESAQIFKIAREIKSDIKTMAIPFGLQKEEGPDAVVEFLESKLPQLVDS